MFKIRVDDQIELQILQEWHAEAYFELIDSNRSFIRQWLGWVDGTKSIDDLNKQFLKVELEKCKNKLSLPFIVFYEGEMVGCVHLMKIDSIRKSTEIGYWLAEKFNGKGIMSKSLNTLADYVFDVLKLDRIEMIIPVKNMKSQAIAERLNFKLEGVLRQNIDINGVLNDAGMWALHKKDWESKKYDFI